MTRIKLQGTGASFPAPLYLRWFKDFEKRNNNLMVDYQAKGSGAGIQDLINQTVDFAASDAAMTDDEIAKVEREVVLLPLTAGEIVFAYNLPNGPSDLRLSREAYTKILMGDLQKWNDPLILSSNPGATLPDSPIIVVVRSDSSGTTNVLSTHLSAVSESWRQKYGINKSIDWPNASHIVKAPKNDGVLALIKQTPGSIGYVEYGFAMQTKQPMATLENQSGNYVKPGTKSGQAALAAAEDIPENLIVWIPDPKGHDCYPIVSYSWMLIYKKYDDPQKANAMKRLIEYCLTEGQKASESIGYIPLPESMVQKVKGACDSVH
jgi:phosphate transport system substrate-binding protein